MSGGLLGFLIVIALIAGVIAVVVLAFAGFVAVLFLGGPLLIILGIILVAGSSVVGGFVGGFLIIVGAIWTWVVWKKD
jgi:hypothetical protein